MSKTPATSNWRPDIQVLRGWAVLTVVLNHARFPYLPGGFLGVDIFFVISGFLMTSLIVDALDGGTFTFAGFYARRVRRLLPAAYATVVVTAILGVLLLDHREFANLADQVAGAFTFTANIVLWKQIDYFNSESALKPLLHLWSLSLEEQYYIVVPFLLFFCPKRYRFPLFLGLTLISLGMCLYFVRQSPSATFYFLPFRAWELGFGSLIALVARRGIVLSKGAIALRWLAGIVLVVVPILVDETGHPGIPALSVCLATALMLALPPRTATSGPFGPIAWVGDRSYSLYLVHWPIFAFANNIYISAMPIWVMVILVALCPIWMEAQYQWIEQRFRRLKLTPVTIGVLIAIPAITIGSVYAWRSVVTPRDEKAYNEGFGPECVSSSDYTAKPTCESHPQPETMVWGDSFAMHLVQGLAATMPNGLAQATWPVCGPFLGIAPIDGVQHQRAWSERCMRFNDQVLAAIGKNTQIRTVVLSSVILPYLPNADKVPWKLLVRDGESLKVDEPSEPLLIDGLKRTVAELHQAGKRVVLIAPPPSINFDMGRCVKRMLDHKPTVTESADCTFARSDYMSYRKQLMDFLNDVRTQNIVSIISFDDFLCEGGRCKALVDGEPIYVDGGHLSPKASALIGEHLHLGQIVEEQAR